MNLLVFLIDLYVGSTRLDPGNPRFRSVMKAFLTVKGWTRLEVAHMLSDEQWCNWFSVEQKARLSNVFASNPNLGKFQIPMAWSVNEAHATHWKSTFEPLRLWMAIDVPVPEGEEPKAAWVPMVWPSYLAAFRWQMLLATRAPPEQTITLAPDMLGFPMGAMCGSQISFGHVTISMNAHFLLPEEAVLRLTNPDVPEFDERRGGRFSPYRYKYGTRASGNIV